MPTPFHLGLFLQGSSVQAWGEPWTGRTGGLESAQMMPWQGGRTALPTCTTPSFGGFAMFGVSREQTIHVVSNPVAKTMAYAAHRG